MARALNVGDPPPIPLQCVLLANWMRRSLTKVSNRAHPPSSAAFSKLFYCSLNDSFPYHTFQPIRCGNDNFRFFYEISRVMAKLCVLGKNGKMVSFFQLPYCNSIFVRTHPVKMFVIIFVIVQQCATTHGLKILLKF